jgi:hypothetical protein
VAAHCCLPISWCGVGDLIHDHHCVMVKVRGRPIPINRLSRASWFQAAAEIKLWRELFGWQAKAQRIKKFEQPVIIWAHTTMPGRLADPGHATIAVKGAVDGLVDAGVLTDDSPPYVRALCFAAPVHGPDSLVLELVSVEQ